MRADGRSIEHLIQPGYVPDLTPPTPHAPAFATVVIDVDSAFSGIDSIAWLGARRAKPGGGDIDRLTRIRPRLEDVHALAGAYVDAMRPEHVEGIARLRRAGVQVVLVSRGVRNSLLKLAYYLGLSPTDVHAVGVRFDALGAFAGYDTTSALTFRDGKRILISTLSLDRPLLVVGDRGDAIPMRTVADGFAEFGGSLDEVVKTVLGA